MNTFKVYIVIALATLATAEPPSSYSYSRASGGVGGGYSGGSLGGGWPGSNNGGYTAVSTGYQTSEGIAVDPQLLEQVRQILLKEEQAGGGWQSNNAGWQSSPSSSYGVPSYTSSGRVIGLDLEGIRQSIQVAQYKQGPVGSVNGGWTSGASNSYSVSNGPSSSYGY
ncbi:keratin, type I cytoskeletal 10-like [Chrysoperla carnea]|uniref:keratin, type I cytoskeletal 10-like n=1 Tax=Chrysoperla carnea TaxID=189513 RepID=UPI001D08A7BC|nr:keratin, type I cytoskeletal 10-like [Chrysoperla carnea]